MFSLFLCLLFAYMLMIVYIMFSMAVVVDSFAIPILENIAYKYSLNQQMQGCLLAIGAAMPEFTTNLLACFRNEVNLGLGAITASGAYDFTMCFGISGLLSKGVVLYWGLYFRDSLVYLLTLGLLTLFCRDGKIELYETIILIGLYPLYLVLVGLIWKGKEEDKQQEMQSNNSCLNIEDKICEENEKLIKEEEVTIIKVGAEKKENVDNNEEQKKSFFTKTANIYSYFIPVWKNYPIISFVIIMAYIFLHSNCILLLIKNISKLAGISDNFLGMFLISLGGNIGDTINSYVAATKNAPALLSSSVLGSQITNIQLCLGFPWLLTLIKQSINHSENPGIEIETESKNHNILLFFLPLIICVLSSQIIFSAFAMKLNKYSGLSLLLVYFGYFIYEAIDNKIF